MYMVFLFGRGDGGLEGGSLGFWRGLDLECVVREGGGWLGNCEKVCLRRCLAGAFGFGG